MARVHAADRWVVEFDGPPLELMTDGRSRFDQRLAALGPDVLEEEFDRERFIGRVREDDPSRPVGDALLDQRNVAGIGNIWKAEGCSEARVDPWRPVAVRSDERLVAIVAAVRSRMLRSASERTTASSPAYTAAPAGRVCAAAPRSPGAGRATPTARRTGVRDAKRKPRTAAARRSQGG